MKLFQRKYGVQAIIDGLALKAAGTQNLQINPSITAGDVRVSKDGGALADIVALPLVTPTGSSLVRVVLSPTEMTADRVAVVFSDLTVGKEWDDEVIIVETYGNDDNEDSFEQVITARTFVRYTIPELSANFQTVLGELRTAAALIPEDPSQYVAFCGTSYDSTTKEVGFCAWLEKNGQVQTDAQTASIVLVDSTGNELASGLLLSGPDVNGLFFGNLIPVDINPDRAYGLVCTIMDADNVNRVSASSPVSWD